MDANMLIVFVAGVTCCLIFRLIMDVVCAPPIVPKSVYIPPPVSNAKMAAVFWLEDYFIPGCDRHSFSVFVNDKCRDDFRLIQDRHSRKYGVLFDRLTLAESRNVSFHRMRA